MPTKLRMAKADVATQGDSLDAAGRAQFRADLEAMLTRLREHADGFEAAVGQVTPALAFRAWCREMEVLLGVASRG